MDTRRRTARQPAGWSGLCLFEGGPVLGWRPCRVLDISALGLGMTLEYLQPAELVGRHVTVELPPLSSSINIRLEGEVKNAEATSEKSVRVGIEFVGLSDSEQVIAAVLSVMNETLVTG